MIAYFFRMLAWAFVLHWRRWSMYRADVFLWILTIWSTLFIQGLILFALGSVTDGNVFGFTPRELILFFGIAILSTGLAQSFVQGIVFRLGRAVSTGQFDGWLLHPLPLILRMFIEDIGFVWFWPHLLVGTTIIFWAAPLNVACFSILCSMLASVMESGFVVALSSFAIRWNAWNPESFLWEYLEQSRSAPVMRSGSTWLIVASLGVVQYSLAIEVVTGGLSVFALVAAALGMLIAAWLCMTLNLRYYSSASG